MTEAELIADILANVDKMFGSPVTIETVDGSSRKEVDVRHIVDASGRTNRSRQAFWVDADGTAKYHGRIFRNYQAPVATLSPRELLLRELATIQTAAPAIVDVVLADATSDGNVPVQFLNASDGVLDKNGNAAAGRWYLAVVDELGQTVTLFRYDPSARP